MTKPVSPHGSRDAITGRACPGKGQPVTVLARWRPGSGGPRNVLIRREDGTRVVRPFRGLRTPRPGAPGGAR